MRIAVAVAFLLVWNARACTTIVAGPGATVDGSTMVTGNNDCLDCDFRLAKVPATSSTRFEARAYREQYPREVSDRSAQYATAALVDEIDRAI